MSNYAGSGSKEPHLCTDFRKTLWNDIILVILCTDSVHLMPVFDISKEQRSRIKYKSELHGAKSWTKLNWTADYWPISRTKRTERTEISVQLNWTVLSSRLHRGSYALIAWLGGFNDICGINRWYLLIRYQFCSDTCRSIFLYSGRGNTTPCIEDGYLESFWLGANAYQSSWFD